MCTQTHAHFPTYPTLQVLKGMGYFKLGVMKWKGQRLDRMGK